MKINWKRSVSRWYGFIGVAAISSFVLSWGISIRCKPTPKERLHYLVFTYGVEAQKLVDFTSAIVPEIRETKIQYSNPLQEQDTQRLFTYIYESVDFYIVPTSWMSLTSGYSCHFTKEEINEAIPSSSSLSLYSFEGKYSGIKLYDHETKTGVASTYFTYQAEKETNEDFYLCFPSSSCHNGVLGKQSLSEALKVAEALLTV